MSSAIRYSGVLAAAAVLAACGDQTAPRGPKMLYAGPYSPLAQVAAPGTVVASVPAVRVEIENTPIANVEVTFTVTRGGGTVAKTVVTTNAQGIANCGAWTLGTDGANAVVASIDDGASVTFDALALTFATNGEVYDLFSHNGAAVPSAAGDGRLYLVVAGRLVLEPDSTYTAAVVNYNSATHEFNVEHYGGPYSQSAERIMFTNYAGTPGSTGAVQIDGIDIDLSWIWDPDEYGRPQDDLYRHVGR
jgi:hypothetical protein